MAITFFVAMSVQLVCQLFKFIVYSIRDKKISPKYLATAGGMPSAHSAFVAALTTYVGLKYGIDGPWFSVSLVFGLIVMYDAFRLRGHVQKHAEAINILQDNIKLKDGLISEKQSEMVGHSPVEVLVGMSIGIVHAVIIWLIIAN